MNRRKFLKTVGATSLAANISPMLSSIKGMERFSNEGPIQRRPLGKTGEYLSIIGLGGVVFRKMTDRQRAEKIMAEAIEAGVNLVDAAL